MLHVAAKRKTSRRPLPAAPDRYMTRAERMAPQTSKHWVAGYRKLVAEWHPTRNIDLYPYEVRAGSSKLVWWKCPKGGDHEWRAAVQNRVPSKSRPKGSGCPFCAGKKISITNCLATMQPKVAAEWHPKKNRKLTPRDVLPGDVRSVWWKCPEGPDHVFQSTIESRSKGRRGCPYCRNWILSVTNSLEAIHPTLAREWHPTKNGKIAAKDVRAADKRSYWWRCTRRPTSYAWRSSIKSRLAGAKCPFCTSFAARFPEIARQWHPTRNKGLDAWKLKPSSRRMVWWRCSKGRDHQWRTSIVQRASEGTGCPFCTRKKVSAKTSSLKALFPTIARQWHPKRNGDLTPAIVAPTSHRKAWWTCGRSGHEWKASVSGRTRKGTADCPFCVGLRAGERTNLAATHPDIAAFWHPTKNGTLRATDVTARSDRQVCWCCPASRDHEWTDRIGQRLRSKFPCPFCANRRRSVTSTLSAARSDLAAQWHPTRNGELTPEDVHIADERAVWWKCAAGRDHEWRTRLDQRVRSGRGCPFCGGWRLSVTNSFAARHPEIAKQVHPTRNRGVDPTRLTSSSTRKLWWTCALNPKHVWRTTVFHRAVRHQGCPTCARASSG